jgi:predicted nucleic acid-binding Zn ribbon protein
MLVRSFCHIHVKACREVLSVDICICVKKCANIAHYAFKREKNAGKKGGYIFVVSFISLEL